jgi:hypothetical protein
MFDLSMWRCRCVCVCARARLGSCACVSACVWRCRCACAWLVGGGFARVCACVGVVRACVRACVRRPAEQQRSIRVSLRGRGRGPAPHALHEHARTAAELGATTHATSRRTACLCWERPLWLAPSGVLRGTACWRVCGCVHMLRHRARHATGRPVVGVLGAYAAIAVCQARSPCHTAHLLHSAPHARHPCTRTRPHTRTHAHTAHTRSPELKALATRLATRAALSDPARVAEERKKRNYAGGEACVCVCVCVYVLCVLMCCVC